MASFFLVVNANWARMVPISKASVGVLLGGLLGPPQKGDWCPPKKVIGACKKRSMVPPKKGNGKTKNKITQNYRNHQKSTTIKRK